MVQQCVGLLDVADARQAQLLDQPILKDRVAAFDAAFGLGAVGQDQLHAQIGHGPAKLE